MILDWSKFFRGKSLFGKKRVFLDYASSTPISRNVARVMEKEISFWGNPSSIHSEGREAKESLMNSRKMVAEVLAVKKEEIIFTSGGTEADNLAIFGLGRRSWGFDLEIISSPVEHSAVLKPLESLEKEGAVVNFISIGEGGKIFPDEVAKQITKNTILISLAYVNSETGMVSPIKEIGSLIKKFKVDNNRAPHEPPFFHTDASQAASLLSIHPHDLGVDLMTLDGGKIYGPKGVGILFVRGGVEIRPVILGGGQEGGLRAGTESIVLARGFATALGEAQKLKLKERSRLEKIKKYAVDEIKKRFPEVLFNGDLKKQLPSYINICIPGVDGEFLSVQLDAAGIAVSSASACRSIGSSGSSYVIEHLPGRENCSKSSLRITMGRETKQIDIDKFVIKLGRIIR